MSIDQPEPVNSNRAVGRSMRRMVPSFPPVLRALRCGLRLPPILPLRQGSHVTGGKCLMKDTLPASPHTGIAFRNIRERCFSAHPDPSRSALVLLYSLKFSLLHDNYNGGTSGTIHVEILDCGYVIGAGDFSVPRKRNSWQPYTLTGSSPHAPAGNLTIKFTGTSEMPWLDKVSLSPP